LPLVDHLGAAAVVIPKNGSHGLPQKWLQIVFANFGRDHNTAGGGLPAGRENG
jgi:hypothetical protein